MSDTWSVRFDDEIRQQVATIVHRTGKSRSDVLRDLVNRGLAASLSEDPASDLRPILAAILNEQFNARHAQANSTELLALALHVFGDPNDSRAGRSALERTRRWVQLKVRDYCAPEEQERTFNDP